MDVLSHVLNSVRVSGAIFFRFEGAAPWGFEVPDIGKVGPRLAPNAKRIVNYHLVTEGRALVDLENGEPFRAESGDLIVLPHGTPHRVSNGQPNEFADGEKGLGQLVSDGPGTIRIIGDQDGERTTILCGFIGCERVADQLFLSGLPDVLHIALRDGPGDEWLIESIEHLVSEAAKRHPGSAALLSRMAETLFVEALRRHMRGLAAGATGWLAAAQDPLVGLALAKLHEHPHRGWTAVELAGTVGASQSVISRRFKQLLGETPAAYLRRWRMHLATEMLINTSDPVLRVASDVGYQSEAAFNRAFKAEYGIPPGQFRRRNLEH